MSEVGLVGLSPTILSVSDSKKKKQSAVNKSASGCRFFAVSCGPLHSVWVLVRTTDAQCWIRVGVATETDRTPGKLWTSCSVSF